MSRALWLPILLVFSSSAVLAQTESGEEKSRPFGERVGEIIERFMKQVEREIRGGAEDDDSSSQDSERRQRQRRKAEDIPETRGADEMMFDGTTTIEKDRVIRSNVVVKGGDLVVFGEIDGDVLVVGGSLYVREGGIVTGDVRVINGDIVKEEGAIIEGYMDKTRGRAIEYREEREKFVRKSTRLHANWVQEATTVDDFIFRYNRAEGLFLGLGSNKRYYWDGQRDYSAYGSVGYGFKSHRWRFNLGLARQFAFDDGRLLEVGVEGHNLTDTKDSWIIPVGENTAAALLIREDFRDYFGRAGFGANLGYYVQRDYFTGQLRVEYLLDRYTSMDKRTEWSVFGGKKIFRLNPPVVEGKMQSVLASFGISTVTRTMYGQEGWSIYATAEVARRGSYGEFDFDQYLLDVRRYQPLSRYDNINIRFRVGTSEGVLPPQKEFELGGISTLNGYPFKFLAGNRMILANAEYIVNGDILHDLNFWPSWLMRGVNFIFIADAGLVRNVSPTTDWNDGFNSIRWKEYSSNLGIGVANRSGTFRLAYIWPTDGSNLSGRIIFRLSRPF